MKPKLTIRQREILIGSILGDGNLARPVTIKSNSRLSITHGQKQLFYNTWMLKEFASFNPTLAIRLLHISIYGTTPVNIFVSKSSSEFTEFFYKCYTPKKTISRDWLKGISALSLAIWYMDDGNKNTLHTQGFDIDSLRVLQEVLMEEFGISCNINDYNKKGRKPSYVVTFISDNLLKFNELIKPHILPEFNYKLYEPLPKFETTCRHCDTVFIKYFNRHTVCGDKTCLLKQERENGVKRRATKHLERFFNCVVCNKEFHPRTSMVITCCKECSHIREMDMQNKKRNKPKFGEIISITVEDSQEEFVYDIEVEGNHNYFCNDILVSNSQAISPHKVLNSILPMGGSILGGAKIIQAGVPGITGSHFHKASKDVYHPVNNPYGYLQHIYPWDKCGRISKEWVEPLKKDRESFERNYELVWSKSNFGYFITTEEFDNCSVDYKVEELLKKANSENWPLHWGIDFAKHKDSTVLTTLAEDPKGELWLVGLIEIQGTDYIEQVGYIKNLFVPGRVLHCCADQTCVGEMPVESLNESGINTTGIMFNIKTKDTMYKNLRYLIQSKMIHWPSKKNQSKYFDEKFEKFQQQLLELEIEFKSSGHIQVHHNLEDVSARDDFPDSLALCAYSKDMYIEPNCEIL